MMLSFTADSFEIDPPGTQISEWWQAELNIQAVFTVRVNDKVILQEPQWCIVELAQALRDWQNKESPRLAFSHSSMDEEEEGLLWFRPIREGEWAVGSVLQAHSSQYRVTTQQLDGAIDDFVYKVERSVSEQLGVDLRTFGEFLV